MSSMSSTYRYRRDNRKLWWVFHYRGTEYTQHRVAKHGSTPPRVGEYVRFHGKRSPSGPWVVEGVQHVLLERKRQVHIWVKRVPDENA